MIKSHLRDKPGYNELSFSIVFNLIKKLVKFLFLVFRERFQRLGQVYPPIFSDHDRWIYSIYVMWSVEEEGYPNLIIVKMYYVRRN